MTRMRVQRRPNGSRRDRDWMSEILPLDPRDADVVRVKSQDMRPVVDRPAPGPGGSRR